MQLCIGGVPKCGKIVHGEMVTKMKHRLDTVSEDGKRIEFCCVCACEAPHLPSDCPGKVVENELRLAIARGEIDYADGTWKPVLR